MGLSCYCNGPAHLVFVDVKSWYKGDLLNFKVLSYKIMNYNPNIMNFSIKNLQIKLNFEPVWPKTSHQANILGRSR